MQYFVPRFVWLAATFCVVSGSLFGGSSEEAIKQEGLVNTLVANTHKVLEKTAKDYTGLLSGILKLLETIVVLVAIQALVITFAVFRTIWVEKLRRAALKGPGPK